jgi:hypothetical protein
MTILVVGAGATGGYFGARLARAGRDVTFLVRPHRGGQLREHGLRIVGPGAGADDGQAVRPNLVLAGELAEPADVVLLSVKATALDQAIAEVAPAVGPRTVVVPFLNGMAHLNVLSKRFGESAVLGGVIIIAAQLNDEGDIAVQLSPPASLTIGTQDGTRTARLQAAYDRPGRRSTRRYHGTWLRGGPPRSSRSWPIWPAAAPTTESRPRCSTWPRCNCASTTTASIRRADRRRQVDQRGRLRLRQVLTSWRAAWLIWLAEIPAASMSSAGVPEPGKPRTAR